MKKNILKYLFTITTLLSASMPIVASAGEVTDSMSRQLQEVTVTSSPIKQKGNRTLVTITRQLRKGKTSTAQMLGDLPNFYYNPADRTVTFNNSSNIVVLVDSIEKPTSDVLNLQHIRFDRMEVVHNPTGKYQGYDVLINFHTKENYEGYEGYVFHNNMLHFNKYNNSTLNVDNENASFAYTKNKWNIYARGNYYWGTGCYDIWTDKKYLFSGLEEKVIPNPDGSRNTTGYEWKAAGYVSVDYTFDPKSSISAVYTYNGDGNRSYYDRHIQRRLPSANIDDIVHRDERTYRKGEEHSLGLFYRNTRGRVKFDTDFNYRYLPSSFRNSVADDGTIDVHNRFRDRMNLTRLRLSAYIESKDESLIFEWGYENNWKKYERIGYENNERLNTNSYLRNRFYLGFGYFRDKINIQIAPWIEAVHLKSNGESENQFPVGATAMFFYRLTRQNWMHLTYTCSTSYPDQGQSSEWGYFSEPYVWNGGNPFLKSSVNHNVSYWIDLFSCFNFQCGYTFNPDKFTTVGEVREGILPSGQHGKYVAFTAQNSRFNKVWTSVSFTKRFKRDFLYKADASIYHTKASWGGFSNSGNGYTFRTSLNYYNTPVRMNFNVVYEYNRVLIPAPQSLTKTGVEWPAISISKYWLKNNALETSLSYGGFFRMFNGDSRTWLKNPALESYKLDHGTARQGQRLTISLTYRFSGGKSVRQYNRSLSTER